MKILAGWPLLIRRCLCTRPPRLHSHSEYSGDSRSGSYSARFLVLKAGGLNHSIAECPLENYPPRRGSDPTSCWNGVGEYPKHGQISDVGRLWDFSCCTSFWDRYVPAGLILETTASVPPDPHARQVLVYEDGRVSLSIFTAVGDKWIERYVYLLFYYCTSNIVLYSTP